tara:strand:+ start:12021 stop:12815 length:795 start_codon:yes stop_codon:yes gene_type:complete
MYQSLEDMEDLITTLDGEQHNTEELLNKMEDDEFYYGHMGKVALSSSSLKTLLKSPKTYLLSLTQELKESQALRDGKLFHWAILEPDVFDNVHIVDVSSRNTKMYQAALAEHGEAYTKKEKANAEVLREILNKNKQVKEYLKDAEYEVPSVKMIEGLAFRGKADILKGDCIIDLKTTADISKFKYSAYKFSYDMQAYLYLQMFPQAKNFKFIVIDKNTMDIGIYECSEEFLEYGKEKFERAIKIYNHFFIDENSLEQHCIKEIL